MTYTIGISSGMFMTAGEGEKETYLTIPRKIFYGGVKGVNFTQLDLESITEFKEPGLQEGVKQIKAMGMSFGVHAESYAMGGAERPISMLDSAIETEYQNAHLRLKEHINGAGEIGAVYLLSHTSETTPFIRLPMHLQPTRLVDPWGRPLKKLLEENKKLAEWAVDAIEKDIITTTHLSGYVKWHFEEKLRKLEMEKKEPTKEQIEEFRKESRREGLLDLVSSQDLEYGAERLAYYIIAKWMQMEKHPLWMAIVGKILKDDELQSTANKPDMSWVPAVSCMYIAGHFNPKSSEYEDPKKLLDKYNLIFIFETPMAGHGIEGLMRLTKPVHIYHLAKAIGSDKIRVAIDAEHMLGSNLEPIKEVQALPYGGGEKVHIVHLGFPTPHQPAHMPIHVGSDAHVYLYKMLFELRKKGFKDGILLFERAGEQTIQQSVIAIRLMVEQLEKDTPPDELPPEFFGVRKDSPELVRQEVVMREHALDPLKGLLTVPEEEHGFLGRAALEKGKGEEWRKEKYK